MLEQKKEMNHKKGYMTAAVSPETGAKMKEALADCRSRLDKIDREIVELLGQRFDVVREVGEIKRAHHWPVLDAGREAEKLTAVSSQAGRYAEQTAALYRLLIEESKGLERKQRIPQLVGLLYDFSDLEPMIAASELAAGRGEAVLVKRVWAGLIDRAQKEGWRGNLWQAYLTEQFISEGHAAARSLERQKTLPVGWQTVFTAEMELLLDWWRLDWRQIAARFRLTLPPEWEPIEDELGNGQGQNPLQRLRRKLTEAENAGGEAASVGFAAALADYYQTYGYGLFSRYGGFVVVVEKGEIRLRPAIQAGLASFEEIIGYDRQKEKLIRNTERFLDGRRANHCLLYGAAGTGKSTCVKALLPRYYERGLRILEVDRDQIGLLPRLFESLRARAYRWIILLDDLSFEEFEVGYKQLKVMMEGGLSGAPENVLFYATGNRRHITRVEAGMTLGAVPSDQKEERLSLAARFGETIFFDSPDRFEFNAIVLGLAKRNGIDLPEEELLTKAGAWELTHHGRCGRSAVQFIQSLL